ncbi:hypothetical protein NM688_g9324 [Phlebia brevispora]|uniref:Uncharacterized protein n=1 Tax=Phlebia brevispora TaxID=194682 RepID=A0ACC1RIU6_9APHY|nr:hypothetical protein NM688_g9324 [Phlebia brevispora]
MLLLRTCAVIRVLAARSSAIAWPSSLNTHEAPEGEQEGVDVEGVGIHGGQNEEGGEFFTEPSDISYEVHPLMNGRPCDESGNVLDDPDSLSQPRTTAAYNDWTPYDSRIQFETAMLLFERTKMSQKNVNTLLELWAASLIQYGGVPPFTDCNDLHAKIDATPLGDAPWTSFKTKFTGTLPENPPSWMTAEYEVWHRNARVCARNMISNPDFAEEFDVAPYREWDNTFERRYNNLFSGDWAWRQADKYTAADEDYHGAMYCPFVIGSDKTTVSVAMGQNDYWPLYFSWGNVWNNVRRAHRNVLVVLGFLAIPKADKQSAKDPLFRKFRRQLFHSSLAVILRSLLPKAGEPKYDIVQCPDGHFHRTVYTIGPYIADYMEQVLVCNIVQGCCPKYRKNLEEIWDGNLRSYQHTELVIQAFDLRTLWEDYGIVGDLIPFTNDFPYADIHELMSGDLLHQIIKGCFKDHLVDWVGEYLILEHGEARASGIMDQIDRRIAAVPAFIGLRNFKQGRDFKQWTGDDSKGLMKVCRSRF